MRHELKKIVEDNGKEILLDKTKLMQVFSDEYPEMKKERRALELALSKKINELLVDCKEEDKKKNLTIAKKRLENVQELTRKNSETVLTSFIFALGWDKSYVDLITNQKAKQPQSNNAPSGTTLPKEQNVITKASDTKQNTSTNTNTNTYSKPKTQSPKIPKVAAATAGNAKVATSSGSIIGVIITVIIIAVCGYFIYRFINPNYKGMIEGFFHSAQKDSEKCFSYFPPQYRDKMKEKYGSEMAWINPLALGQDIKVVFLDSEKISDSDIKDIEEDIKEKYDANVNISAAYEYKINISMLGTSDIYVKIGRIGLKWYILYMP